MEATAQQKVELRRHMRGQRLELSVEQVAAKSAAIRQRLARLPAFVAARRVFAFVSRGHEVMTHELIEQLLTEGRQVGVPVFDPAKDEYGAGLIQKFPDDLIPSKLDILEPRPGKARPVGMEFFDVLLVPGLAFDESGSRLGRGKGYYDRMLEFATGVKIGLAYDFEMLHEVPMHDHDVHMDFIITETRLITCKRKLT